jgi:hypothetical protein
MSTYLVWRAMRRLERRAVVRGRSGRRFMLCESSHGYWYARRGNRHTCSPFASRTDAMDMLIFL